MEIVLPHTKPILSVLICHLPERRNKLERLLGQIYLQVNEHPVEVIINDDPYKTTGEKRNELLSIANAPYVMCADDDDEWSESMLDRVMPYLDGKNNGVGFIMEFRFGKHIIPMICCNAVNESKQYNGSIFRPLTHIQVHKKEHCVPFRHIIKGEDVYWTQEMVEVLRGKRCAFIYETLYFYNSHQ